LDEKALLNAVGVPQGRSLRRNAAGELVDIWGTPFVLDVSREGEEVVICVRSCGVDRQCGTADDILARGTYVTRAGT
jgi:hypothetical protein